MDKIAVYTIVLNEEAHIERWASSCAEAEYRVVVDTGSTDGTVEAAKDMGCTVHKININPWRFDVARNVALALVPSHARYCIALDADEVLVNPWKEELLSLPKVVTRVRYLYTWSWDKNGSPGLQYNGDKIHARNGFHWMHPVHEVITPYVNEQIEGFCDLEIHHYPDSSKPRDYLPLLELSVRENPSNDRNAHYLGREYYFKGDYENAAAELTRHINMSGWGVEQAQSCIYMFKIEKKKEWLEKAVDLAPGRREPLVELAVHHYEKSQWSLCNVYAKQSLSIKEKPLEYLCSEEAWGSLPYDMAAISFYHLGNKKEAIENGKMACKLSPKDERLNRNLYYYLNGAYNAE